MHLFVDTTFNITVGVLSENLEWLAYESIESKKSSALLHKIIYDLLEELKLEFFCIKSIIQVGGPGSYTGMRVSEGLSQVFSWQGIERYSFYHFSVPELLDIDEGVWISKAFKGEYFTYSWKMNNSKKNLVKISDFVKEKGQPYYSNTEFDSDFVIKSTARMIKEEPQKIFSSILEDKIQEDIFYYRELEDEFQRSSV